MEPAPTTIGEAIRHFSDPDRCLSPSAAPPPHPNKRDAYEAILNVVVVGWRMKPEIHSAYRAMGYEDADLAKVGMPVTCKELPE